MDSVLIEFPRPFPLALTGGYQESFLQSVRAPSLCAAAQCAAAGGQRRPSGGRAGAASSSFRRPWLRVRSPIPVDVPPAGPLGWGDAPTCSAPASPTSVIRGRLVGCDSVRTRRSQCIMSSDENSFFGLKVPEGSDRRELYKSQYRAIYTCTPGPLMQTRAQRARAAAVEGA
jgi:hypothetical protein